MKRRRTVTKAQVLAALLLDAAGPHYGFEIAITTGVALGTVYPILAVFEADGVVASSWEDVDPVSVGRPRRRLYELTQVGRRIAREEIAWFETARPDGVLLPNRERVSA